MSRSARIGCALVVLILLAAFVWFQVLGTDLDPILGPVETWQG